MVSFKSLSFFVGLLALISQSQCFFQSPLGLPSRKGYVSLSSTTRWTTPALRIGRVVDVSMMAKGEKGKKGKDDEKPSKSKALATDKKDSEEGNVKLAKQDTDVKGTDTKSILKSGKEKMAKTVENTKAALASIRTGRPSPNILDKVMVSYYGADTPLPQVASVQVLGATQIQVDPFEKSMLKDVEKALLQSDLGMTPSNDGNVIRLNVPPLTSETRAKYAKQARQVAEDGKVAIRNIRRTAVDAIKKLEKDKKIGEDESEGGQEDCQKDTDKAIKEIDTLCEAKEKELNKV